MAAQAASLAQAREALPILPQDRLYVRGTELSGPGNGHFHPGCRYQWTWNYPHPVGVIPGHSDIARASIAVTPVIPVFQDSAIVNDITGTVDGPLGVDINFGTRPAVIGAQIKIPGRDALSPA